MTTSIVEWLRQLFGAGLPWVVVPPWCVGVRVRLGRSARALPPGFHIRVPLLDHVQLVSTRVRFTSGQPVTIAGSRRGYVRVRCATVGFWIVDPVAAMLHFAQVEHALQALVTIACSRFDNAEAALEYVAAEVRTHGVQVDSLEYSEDTEVRAFKLQQNDCRIWMNSSEKDVW